jgi:hypothetical protein
MSTAPLLGTYASTISDMAVPHFGSIETLVHQTGGGSSVDDRGQAIEELGHAIDHLISLSMFDVDESFAKANTEAIHILMRSRRSIFEECKEVISNNRQMRHLIMGRSDISSN